MKLRSKILRMTLPLVLIPFILISLAIYFFIVRSYDQRENLQTSIRLNESIAGLNDKVDQTNQQIAIFVNAPSIQTYLKTQLDGKVGSKESDEALSLMKSIMDDDYNLLDISLLNTKGKVVLSSSRLDDSQKAVADALALQVFRRSLVARSNQFPVQQLEEENYASIHTGKVETDKFLGLAKLTFNTSFLKSPLRRRILEGMSLVCFDDRGVVWLNSPAEPFNAETLQKVDWNNTSTFSVENPEFQKISSPDGNSSYRIYRLSIRKHAIQPNFGKIPGESWHLGVVEPVAAPTGLRAFQLSFGLIILLSVLAVIWVSAVSAKRIVRPIEKVSRATARIAKGHHDELDLDITTGDEVEDLAKAVANMNRELEQYQKQLFNTAKMAAMGEMTSEISHEIQNRISGVSLWLQHLDAEVSETDDRREYIDEMNLGLAGFIEMLARLKQYYRKPELNKQECDIVELLEEVVSFIEPEAKAKKIRISFNNLAKQTMLCCDIEQLRGVVINLLLNAFEASSLENEVILTAMDEENCFVFTVKDNGYGIPQADLEKVFLPFFTTKESGSGLGLSIVKNIIEEHGGTVSVISELKRGTTFRITLPRTSE